MISSGEQTALYLTSIVILLGTLTTFIVQYVRSRRRRRGPDDSGDSGSLIIYSDDPDENPLEVELIGNGGGDLDYPVAVVTEAVTDYPQKVALSTSLGFGGHNAALAFSPYKG